jgi:predicted Zn-dependent protease with MMP-like domain
MKRDIFESLVIEAMSTLPIRVRKAIKNVAIVIEQEPRRKKMSEVSIKRDEMLLGLYEGIPLTQRGSGYFGVLPDKITIFQKSIEALSRESEEEVATLVCEVVWHEIGHYFGLSDAELDILEKKKKNPALPISREK